MRSNAVRGKFPNFFHRFSSWTTTKTLDITRKLNHLKRRRTKIRLPSHFSRRSTVVQSVYRMISDFVFNFSSRIDDDISVEVSSVGDLSSVSYLLSARGNLILSQTERVANQNKVVISFKASFAMVPSAQFVVYYITSTGKIVAGNTEIPVSGLNNFVSFVCRHRSSSRLNRHILSKGYDSNFRR